MKTNYLCILVLTSVIFVGPATSSENDVDINEAGTSTSICDKADTVLVIEKSHQSYKVIISRNEDFTCHFVEVLKLPIVGFDIIIPDPKTDPDGQRWGILEANSLPFIELHYSPLQGTPSRVAADVWDYVERNLALL